MHLYLLEMLECPNCHGRLDWNLQEPLSEVKDSRIIERPIFFTVQPFVDIDKPVVYLYLDTEFNSVYIYVDIGGFM